MQRIFTNILFLLLIPFFANAQANYKKGYVVTTQGDTLKGFIDYREWNRNPDKIAFKTSIESKEEKIFTPNTSQRFVIEGLDAFVRFEGRITMDRLELEHLITVKDTSSLYRVIFLQELQKGKYINLYSYTDDKKARFFIQTPEQEKPIELIYRRSLDPVTGGVASANLYVGQLWYYANKNGVQSAKLKRAIESSTYSKNNLLVVVSQINEINQKEQSKGKEPYHRFFAGGGLNRSFVEVKGDHPLVKGTSNYFYMPKLLAGVDLFLNPNVQRTIFRAQVSVTQNKADLYGQRDRSHETVYYNQSFNQTLISFTPQFIYNVYNTTKLKYYLGAGGALNYSFYSSMKDIAEFKSNYTGSTDRDEKEGNFAFSRFWYAYPIKTGFIINNKFDVGLAYLSPVIFSQYINYTYEVSALHVEVNYLFNKKK